MPVKDQILHLLDELDDQRQQQVLAYLKGLLDGPQPDTKKGLEALVGTISDSDLDKMLAAIEEHQYIDKDDAPKFD